MTRYSGDDGRGKNGVKCVIDQVKQGRRAVKIWDPCMSDNFSGNVMGKKCNCCVLVFRTLDQDPSVAPGGGALHLEPHPYRLRCPTARGSSGFPVQSSPVFDLVPSHRRRPLLTPLTCECFPGLRLIGNGNVVTTSTNNPPTLLLLLRFRVCRTLSSRYDGVELQCLPTS